MWTVTVKHTGTGTFSIIDGSNCHCWIALTMASFSGGNAGLTMRGRIAQT